MLEIIWTKLINRHHNDLLADHFGIHKNRKLVAGKYYWLTLYTNIEVYVWRWDVYLALKTIEHKPYGDL